MSKERKATRKELAWALQEILESHNIWNHLNSFSATGQKVGDIIDRLEDEEVSEPDEHGI